MNTKEMVEKLKLVKHQIDGAIALIEAGCVKPDPKYEARQIANRIEIGDFVITDRFQTIPECYVPGRPTVSQLALDDPLVSRK